MFVVVYPPGLRGIQIGDPSGLSGDRRLVLAFLLLGEKDGVDVRENTSLGAGDVAEELVQLFVVSDGELDVTRDDSGSLIVLGGVAGEFEKLGGEVLEYRGHVDRGSRAHSLGISPLSEVPCHAADGELETCLGAPGRGLALSSSPSLGQGKI